MPQLAGLANASSYAEGSSSLTGAGAMRAASLSSMNLVATMQGQRVVMEDQYVLAAMMPQMIRAIIPYFGFVLAMKAKEIHTPNIDTRATYDSIQVGEMTMLPGGGAIDVFVSTPQAKFLEFGFVHYQTGEWIFNPFMIPAADAVTPLFVDAVSQIASTAAGLRFFSGAAAASPAAPVLGTIRGALYSYSKYAGDLQVLGFGGLSASRGYAIKGAKGIGNVQAAQSGTLAARFARLTVGQYGGSAIRGGNFGGNLLTGTSGRIYNRISGRIFGGALSDIR